MTRCLITVLALVQVLLGSAAHAADAISDGQWFHGFLKTAAAHTIGRGEGVTVAVIDSGVDATHPDLAGSVLSGVDLVGAGDGRLDVYGHGTAMAGIIAAHGKVQGVAPQAKILPIRVMERGEAARDRQAVGIRRAVAAGAKVISISIAGPGEDLLQRQEVEAALAADVVIVAGAGNKPEAENVQYPAAIEGVVAVSGLDRNGALWARSATGSQLVLAAPSEGISSTGLRKTHYVSDGTSYATAIVAGAVALVRAKFPNLKASEVIRRLTATAIDKGTPGRDSSYGYGILNIVGALTADVPQASPSPSSTVANAGGPTQGPGDSGGGSRIPWWVWALAAVAVGAALVVWSLLRMRAPQ